MGSLKRSSFPPVLKHYLPDYQPSFVDLGPKRGGSSPRGSGCRCQTDGEEKSKTESSSSRPTRPRRASKSPTPVHRETTILLHRKGELKRYRQNYENWQAAKAELKEENSRQLRQRIFLQQELIRKQDELSSRRYRELQDEVDMKRDAERELKQSQTEALQQICRQSLDDDRQKAVEERKAKKKENGSKDSLVSQGSARPSGAPTFQPPIKGQAPQVSRRSSRGALSLEEALATQPSMVAEEQEEEVAATEEEGRDEAGLTDEQLEGSEEEPLPWHAEQLYKLYGRQADYFLKPKPEEKERKKTVTLSNSKQLRLKGRAGAGSLWTSFRNESQAKLLQQDMQISPDLKAAYSAFVRQCLSRRKKPVKRNFYAEEDVPEMDRLLDQSRILSVHDYKHMVEVMFRSSTMNQDRTGVLLHNNPPPNLNNWTGDESCGRYMPSWLPDYEEEEEDPAYTKYIKVKPKPQKSDAGSSPVRARSAASRSSQGRGDDLSANLQAVSIDTALKQQRDQWEFLRSMKPKSRKPKTPKYLFLTEAAATVPGQFSKQRKELLEARNIPQAFNSKTDPKGQSALAMVGDGSSHRGSVFSVGTPRSVQRSQSEVAGHFTSSWQPLSLDALVEYKQAVTALGQGDFNHGTVPRWSVEKAH